MRFNNAEALGEYLTNLDDIYEPYAAGMWGLGIRSADMIANARDEVLANALAHPKKPDIAHHIHASDMIARSRPAGILKWVLVILKWVLGSWENHALTF